MARIPNRIRTIRKERKLSQVQLAELLGTAQSQVQKLEAGDRRLTIEWLSRLSQALQCQLGDLVDLESSGIYSYQTPSSSALHAAEHGGNQAGPVVPFYEHALPGEPLKILVGADYKTTTPAHPKQLGRKNAFAFRCLGKEMEPRYRPGDIVYAASGDPSPGEDIVIEFYSSVIVLGEYIKTDKTKNIVIYRFLSSPEIHLANMDDIKALYSVVGRG